MGVTRTPAEKIGYLASHYPAVSHSFVWREVQALRALGMPVETISVWRTPDSELLTGEDREAAATTFAILPIRAVRFITIHTRAFGRRPLAYLRTLARAVRLASPGARGRLWQIFYFGEAVVVADHCARAGVRHLHAQFADSAMDVALLATAYAGGDRTWSVALHGPVEFYNVDTRRLPEKTADADFVQAISEFGRSQVMSFLDEEEWAKVHVVHCGVDPTVYAASEASTQGRAPGAIDILCVGRLVHHKGQSLLIRSVAELVRRGIDARLVLIGDGPSRGSLEKLVATLGLTGRVSVLGSVGQDEIQAHYLSCDVFCLPSFAEGIPVVLMEAMALQRPVVTTAVMGIPELVEHDISGLIVPPGNADALVAAVCALADNPARRREMGSAGRAKIVAEFDVRRSAEQLRVLFEAARPELRRDPAAAGGMSSNGSAVDDPQVVSA